MYDTPIQPYRVDEFVCTLIECRNITKVHRFLVCGTGSPLRRLDRRHRRFELNRVPIMMLLPGGRDGGPNRAPMRNGTTHSRQRAFHTKNRSRL